MLDISNFKNFKNLKNHRKTVAILWQNNGIDFLCLKKCLKYLESA